MSECNSKGQALDLSEDLMHYASRVLRLRDNSELRVWNGRGQEFMGTLHYLSKKLAEIRITEGPLPLQDTELMRPVWIAQALPEGDKMDWVLEKTTELGASAFWPIQAQRSVVRLNAERQEKKAAHWERIVQAASLQSERQHLPQLHSAMSLEAAFESIAKQAPGAQLLWFTPEASTTLTQWCTGVSGQLPVTQPLQTLVICVGPEGGWSGEETQWAVEHGAVALQFSRRILRTETFALACLSQLTALLQLESKA
ncbi:16S rRNA (uracil(1498)-N(3))-methyltransferase [Limnobacter litoralis]|uniref:Ribosomal RNA small subunit methyltransferase E n=1 Tax=Limnobacter litoralis TaxID=481366 RepID=A0ABQ5YRQ8_9BURK|nr:ribosomal RNA small subunit methyltransferase E [Limnobacter litoralis]